MAAFLLFLLPKPSDEAEQRQQMVPRAHLLRDLAQAGRACSAALALDALHLEVNPLAEVTAVTEAGGEQLPRLLGALRLDAPLL